MKLTIVTINYNSSENTIKLLESLKNQTDKNFGVVVIDNNSDDIGKLMDYKTLETNITYIKNDRNFGYSGGNNVGIKKFLENGSDWVLLLNNDTVPESHLVEHLRANLEGREDIIGLALDESSRIAYAGQIQWLKPTLIHIPTSQVGNRKSVDKLYAIGGAILIHKKVFDKIGLLNENYFLYFEDADFCQRARKVGISISFLPEIKISHSVSSSTKKLGSSMLLRYHYRNALYFNLKNGPWYIKFLVWPWSWIVVIKQVIKILVGKNREQSLAILKGVGDWYADRMGKLPACRQAGMIKIGIECESIEGKNPVWGVGRMIIKLLEEISRRLELEKDFRFVLYFKDSIPDFPFLNAPIFEKKMVPVPFFKNRLFPIYYFALLPIRLWFEGLDVMFWPNYMLPIIAFDKSIVMLTEDAYYETYKGKLPFRYRLAYWVFTNWTAKFATKIMAISETSKKNVAKLYNIIPNRVVVNHLGINFDKIENFKLKIENYPYILYVGQAFPRRHLKETILAFEKIVPDFPDLKLIAIGPDKYPPAGRVGETPTIKSLVSQVNNKFHREAVIHKDYIKDDELAELYAGAKALVYVSDREAFGLPPMEALSFGVPPIIADNELGHELFGDYAFYVSNPSPDGIAEGIRQALTQTEKIAKIKTNGPEFIKKYNWKSFTDRFLETLNLIRN